VNESAKPVLPQPIPGVLQHNGGLHVPRVARIGERYHAAGTGSRTPEQRFHIGVTTDDAVESDDISVRQGVGGCGEVTEDELSGEGGVARGQVAPRGLEVTGRRVRERDAGQTGAGEFHGDHTNPAADVEEVEPLQRATTEFRQKDSRGGVRAAALIASPITFRLLGIEVGGCSARSSATGQVVNLEGARG